MSGDRGYAGIPMDERQRRSAIDNGVLEAPFDEEFWSKVLKKFSPGKISWTRAMDEVRLERLLERHGKDTLLVMIRDWSKSKDYSGQETLIKSLEFLISRFTELLLEKDKDDDYKYFRDETQPARPTLLHIAAAQNFVHVVTHLVQRYPTLVYIDTEQAENRRSLLPVEIALLSHHDETAAFLISSMKPMWIHDLFTYDNDFKGSKFSFGEYISFRDMKRSVVAVLNSFVNPQWPYLPDRKRENTKESELIERAWESVPDEPLKWDFFYFILDGDNKGREPKINGEKNKDFDAKSRSCLLHLAESGNKEAITHPVVRMFVARKWKKFGWWFRLEAFLYMVYLTLLSYAFIYGAMRNNPNEYNEPADKFRLFCEVVCIVLLMLYILEEAFQLIREFPFYFKDPYNYFDWLGRILTFLVIPLRLTDKNAQWSFASLGYLFSFLSVFKFAPVTKTTGLYTKTLERIVKSDISRFLTVFVVVCVGFCGAMFLALTATGSQNVFSGYAWLMLAAVRVLTDAQPVKDDYQKFSWFTILILLGYMTIVGVILLNMLIAQMGDTYKEAKENAKVEYAVDKMKILGRLEQRFIGANFRTRHYVGGVDLTEADLVEEMLEDNEERNPWESGEEKLTAVRVILKKMVRNIPGKSD